jgi:hypothetical protein
MDKLTKPANAMPYTPRIASAAINHNGKIWTGRRHSEIMYDIWKVDEKAKIPQSEQGFVTDTGEFVNRFQAGAIAFRAGQTKERKQTLLSEHVW